MNESDEILGGEEEDDQVDVLGNQAPVDWGEQPFSDDLMDAAARRYLEQGSRSTGSSGRNPGAPRGRRR